MRRRGLPERISYYSKKLSFSFHNIVRPHMFLREDMLWCASQARQKGFSYRSRRVILVRNLACIVLTSASAPEAGDSKWGMARCCHIKEYVKTFQQHLAISHFESPASGRRPSRAHWQRRLHRRMQNKLATAHWIYVFNNWIYAF